MKFENRKSFVPEASDVSGPGVDLWQDAEFNSDERTDHDTLMAEVDRRRRAGRTLEVSVKEAEAKWRKT